MDMTYGLGTKILTIGKSKIDFNKVPLTQYIIGATQPLLMTKDPHKKRAMKYLCAAVNELHKAQNNK